MNRKARSTRVAINRLSHAWHLADDDERAELAPNYIAALWAEVEALDRLRRSCRVREVEARQRHVRERQGLDAQLRAAERRVKHLETERDELADMVDRWAMGLATSREKGRARPGAKKGD